MSNLATSIDGAQDSLRIIVATDLQPRSALSLRRAIALASGVGARLRVVHAVPKTQSKTKARTWKNVAYAQLLSAIDEATTGRGSALIDIEVGIGRPLAVITAAARDAQADLIVIAAP